MTNGLLKFINTEDRLYKNLVKMDVNEDVQYTTLKFVYFLKYTLSQNQICLSTILPEHIHPL